MIYLSDNVDGEILFDNNNISFLPKHGRVLIFDQSLFHEGLKNSSNKYFIRSEFMYYRELPVENENDITAMQLYNEAKISYKINPKQSKELESKAFQLSSLLEDTILNL